MCVHSRIARKVKPNAFNCKQETIDNVILVNIVSKFLYFKTSPQFITNYRSKCCPPPWMPFQQREQLINRDDVSRILGHAPTRSCRVKIKQVMQSWDAIFIMLDNSNTR